MGESLHVALSHDLWFKKLRQGNENSKTQIKSDESRVCVFWAWVFMQSLVRNRYSREACVVHSNMGFSVFSFIDHLYELHLQIMMDLSVQRNTEEFERAENDSLIYVSFRH